MRGVEEAITIAGEVWDAWGKSRQEQLNDGRRAYFWREKRELIFVVNHIQMWVKEEPNFGYGPHHSMDDTKKAGKIVKELKKTIRRNINDPRIQITLSGRDILALENFALDSSQMYMGESGTSDRGGTSDQVDVPKFLNELGNDYIENPHKIEPPRSLSFRDVFRQVIRRRP